MPDISRNRPNSKFTSDSWLTPEWLIRACGDFDLDPACEAVMPWKTATRMIALPEDGLAAQWEGRVWCNPPYSDILPWAIKLFKHGNGLFLVPAKSTDVVWAQFTLQAADAVLFIAGRLKFWYPDGTESAEAWGPSMLCAFGQQNVECLQRLSKTSLPGWLAVKL